MTQVKPFIVRLETTIELLAKNHQAARDRATDIIYGGEPLVDGEHMQREIVLVEDEEGRDEEEVNA